MSPGPSRVRWNDVEQDAIVRQAASVLCNSQFVMGDTRGQVQVFLDKIQECLPAERRRPGLLSLSSLAPGLQRKLRGAWKASGSPALCGWMVEFFENGPMVQMHMVEPPTHVKLELAAAVTRQSSQPSAEASAAVPEAPTAETIPAVVPEVKPEPAEAPEPRPALGAALLEAIGNLPQPQRIDLDELALKVAALVPTPNERIVYVPVVEPCTFDLFEEAERHLTVEQKVNLAIRAVIGSANPAHTVSKLARDGVASAPVKRQLTVTPARPMGKIKVMVLHLDGTQWETLVSQLEAKGMMEFVELHGSEDKSCEFCVSHYFEVPHSETDRVRLKHGLDGSHIRVCNGVSSMVVEITKYVEAQL